MAKAISYIRFSSTTQAKGASLNRQTEMIQIWLRKNPNVNLSDLEYRDLGRSGFHGTNLKHGFGELLDAIEQGLIESGDFILVEAIDRIGRLPTIQALNIITGICMKGVKIITLEDDNEYSQESIGRNSGIIYYLIGKIDMAYQYSKNLSRRVGDAWERKRKDAQTGKVVNRKSFWYITKCSDGTYSRITPEEKILVNKIFTMFVSGVSQNKIVSYLKEYDGTRFKKYSPTALKKMLTNKTAIGYWEDTPNVYEPAISEELFYSVQSKLNERKRLTGPYRKGEGAKQGIPTGSKSNHIMAGLVKCKKCGKNYAVRNQKHSATVMYCSNASKGNCTNTKVIPIAVLNEFRVRTQASFIKKIMKSRASNENQKKIITIDGKIKTVRESIANLLELVERGVKSAGLRIKELEEELESLELQRVGLTQVEPSSINIANIKQAGLDLSADPLLLNGMLKQSGYKIEVDCSIMSIGIDSMEYVRYAKTGSNIGNYEVLVDGKLERIIKPVDSSLSIEEQIMKSL